MENNLDHAAEGARVAILIMDRDLCLRFLSPDAGTWFGLTAADIGRDVAGLALPAAGAALAEEARAVLATSRRSQREIRLADGAWVMRTIVPYRGGSDHGDGVLAAFIDITARKAADAARSVPKRYAEAVIDAIREPLVALDENMDIVFASRSFYRFFATSPARALGHPLTESDDHSLDVRSLAPFIERLRGGARRIDGHAMDVTLPNGEHRSLLLSARRIAGLREGGRNILVSIEDVTELVAARQAAEQAREKAEQASLAKTRFLAAASHDLRQPLQALQLLRTLLAEKVTDPEARKLVARFATALRLFSDLLDAILDINRLDAGAIHPDVTAFPVGDLFARLRDDLMLQVEAAALDWRVVPSSAIVESDPHLLERILRNLLSNAIKYTPKGRILLGCRHRGAHLSIQVWDTGLGIPEAEQQTIFQEFTQGAGASRFLHGPGLGLGLSIVQRLAERLGHRVELVSRAGRGSMFSIDVPLAPPGAAPASALLPPSRAASYGSILIVEKDPAVREALAMFVASRGLEPATAASGEEALALLAERPRPPDTLVVGYEPAGALDGLATIRRLRAAAGQEIPALVLTADVSAASLRTIAASGLPHLAKPVAPAVLWQALQALAEGAPTAPSASPATRTSATTGAAPEKATIFVVEDNQAVRRAMRTFLEASGYRVEEYATGDAFLEALPADATGCVILDFRLPGMDGIEVLRHLAARGSRLPAIMLTGTGAVTTAVAAMKAGAVDFVEKPADGDELVAAIARALDRATPPGGEKEAAASREIARLTRRQREILDLVVAGHANKEIASRLGINQRTVETHRALVMRKLGAKSLPELVRLVLSASLAPAVPLPVR